MTLTFEELVPGGFQPTSVDGGLPKLVRIWEYLRDLNTGGYGGAVLVDVKDAISKGHNGVTSCSPFTGTCIYMALDPRPFNAAQPWSLKEPYEPIFDGGKPLDVNFYRLHNGFSLSSYASVKDKKFAGWKADFKKRYVERIPQLAHDFSAFKFINHSAGSVIALNLGTRVDSKRMRRGDMVGIDWHNGNGHATFCWNVHLNEKGEVDCFQFISSNGTSANGGAGITIFRYPDVRPPPAGRERARSSHLRRKNDRDARECEEAHGSAWAADVHFRESLLRRRPSRPRRLCRSALRRRKVQGRDAGHRNHPPSRLTTPRLHSTCCRGCWLKAYLWRSPGPRRSPMSTEGSDPGD